MSKKILMAEDDVHIAKLIEFMLKKNGFEVTPCLNGRIAVEKLPEQKWDLIMLDVMMPELDGYGALKEIRSNSEYQSTPVLMLTAKGSEQDISVAKDLGANQFLRKPFEPNELVEVVKKLIGA